MLKILGIDYGLAHLGLAKSDGILAEPYKTIDYLNLTAAMGIIRKIVELEKIEKIVIGVSENKMAVKTQEFSKMLEKQLAVPVDLWDETLTSFEARNKLSQLHRSVKLRKKHEHEFAAAVILQEYLDHLHN